MESSQSDSYFEEEEEEEEQETEELEEDENESCASKKRRDCMFVGGTQATWPEFVEIITNYLTKDGSERFPPQMTPQERQCVRRRAKGFYFCHTKGQLMKVTPAKRGEQFN